MNKEQPQLTTEQKINYLFNKKWEEEHQPPPSAWDVLAFPLLIGGILVFTGIITQYIYFF